MEDINSAEQIEALSPEAVNNMSAGQLGGIAPEVIASMTAEQMLAMTYPIFAMSGMSASLMEMMPPEAMTGVYGKIISAMPPEARAGMDMISATPEELVVEVDWANIPTLAMDAGVTVFKDAMANCSSHAEAFEIACEPADLHMPEDMGIRGLAKYG